jgi:formate dehydrogenase iron-sulfur subunit
MAENAFLYDGSLCIACRSCQVACKQWNYLPGEKTTFFAKAGGYQNPSDLSPITWTIIKFYEIMEDNQVQWLFRRFHCFHCTDAACIMACPVEPKAMTRHPEFGTVYVNQELCIGCGACEEACPFGVPHVDMKLEKSRKCTGCYDRVANGLLPACVKTCPTQAITYGPKDEIYKRAADRLNQLKKEGFKPAMYGTKELSGLHSILVLPAPLSNYDVPINPKVPEGLGMLHEIIRAMPGVTITAAMVGVAMAKLRQWREKAAEAEA